MIDVAEVRHALTAQAVLDRYGHRTRRGGRNELESSACPRRSDHSRRAFTINVRTGQWHCFPCGIGGDPIRLVAEFERLSDRDDFPAVLALAAEIAGVASSDVPDDERLRRREQYAREAAARDAAIARERAERDQRAVPTATAYWRDLVDTHQRGLEYLAERDLSAALGLLRFDHHLAGSLAVSLRTSNGEIRNVVRRQLPELGEPKTWGLRGCPTAGTLLGSVTQIRAGVPVIVTEGVADTLTAALAWPDATVLGAHGASNLAAIVRVAAPRVRGVGTRLLLVPHNDRAGMANAKAAGSVALDADLSVLEGTLAVIRHGEKDLNDAWRKGWRP